LATFCAATEDPRNFFSRSHYTGDSPFIIEISEQQAQEWLFR